MPKSAAANKLAFVFCIGFALPSYTFCFFISTRFSKYRQEWVYQIFFESLLRLLPSNSAPDGPLIAHGTLDAQKIGITTEMLRDNVSSL